jgi:predicted transcriptional regulator
MLFDNKRNEFEIIREILFLANKEIKKTRLMYQTNMCYNHFNKYLKFLLNNGLIEERFNTPKGRVYITTEKGNKWLEKITMLIEQF